MSEFFTYRPVGGGRRVTGASTRNQTPESPAVFAGAGGDTGELVVNLRHEVV